VPRAVAVDPHWLRVIHFNDVSLSRLFHLGVESTPYAWSVKRALSDSVSALESEYNVVVHGGNHGTWVKVESCSPATSANIDGDVRG